MVALRLCLRGGATDRRCQPERLRACDSGVAYAAIGRSLVLLQRKNFYSVLKKIVRPDILVGRQCCSHRGPLPSLVLATPCKIYAPSSNVDPTRHTPRLADISRHVSGYLQCRGDPAPVQRAVWSHVAPGSLQPARPRLAAAGCSTAGYGLFLRADVA